MENDKYLKLTNTVYKVLEFFPETDPLKHRAKDKALVIMEHLVLINETSGWTSFHKEKIKVQLLEDIETLLGYLWIGKSQGWLNSVNFLIVANEYEKVKKELGSVMGPVIEPTQPMPSPVVKITDISDRQTKILDFLGKNQKAQVMDLQTILPDITKRTIRRDLDELLEMGQIERDGTFNQVVYRMRASH